MTYHQDPIKINPDQGPSFRTISCGKYHLMAIDNDGNLWGYNDNISDITDYGQSGFLGEKTLHLKRITKDIQFKFVTCAKNSTCAIDTDGSLYVCGICSYDEKDSHSYSKIWIKAILPVFRRDCKFSERQVYYLPNLVKIESNIRFNYASIGIDSLFVDTQNRAWHYGRFFSSDNGMHEIDIKTKIKSVWCQNDMGYVLSRGGILYVVGLGTNRERNFYEDSNLGNKILKLPNEKA